MAFLYAAGAYAAPYLVAAGTYLATTATTAATTVVAATTPLVTATATKAAQIAAVYFASTPLRWVCTDTTLFNEEHCASALKSVGCFWMKATEATSCTGAWAASGQMVYDIADLMQTLKNGCTGG